MRRKEKRASLKWRKLPAYQRTRKRLVREHLDELFIQQMVAFEVSRIIRTHGHRSILEIRSPSEQVH